MELPNIGDGYLPQADGLNHPAIQPCLPYIPKIVLPLWELLDVSKRQGEHKDCWLQAVAGRLATNQRITKTLHEEGAPLLVGTDTSVRFVLQGFSLHEELNLFVQAGLTPYEAIRCATTEPARFLGLEAEAGTVAQGKRADLILVNENPLENINALRSVEGVFTSGYALDRTDLDRLLAQQAEMAIQSAVDSEPIPIVSDQNNRASMTGMMGG